MSCQRGGGIKQRRGEAECDLAHLSSSSRSWAGVALASAESAIGPSPAFLERGFFFFSGASADGALGPVSSTASRASATIRTGCLAADLATSLVATALVSSPGALGANAGALATKKLSTCCFIGLGFACSVGQEWMIRKLVCQNKRANLVPRGLLHVSKGR